MGMYDTVVFKCPSCQTAIAGQSKTGPCDLDVYSEADAPADVMTNFNGEGLRCPKCGKSYEISVQATVVTNLTPACWESDDDEPFFVWDLEWKGKLP